MQEIESLNGRVFIGDKINFENQNLPDPLLIPLILFKVSAGFPSPADDYIETSIDLNRELIKHPEATFLVRAGGDSMLGGLIDVNTVLVVDRMIETKSGDIVIARFGNDMCVRQLIISDEGKVLLKSKNDSYKPIEVSDDTDFEIWGKVVWSINKH